MLCSELFSPPGARSRPVPRGAQGVVAALATASLLLSAACSSGGAEGASSGTGTASPTAPQGSGSPSPGASAELPPAKGSAKAVSTLAEGLKSPWGLAALPGGDLLVASRDEGTIHRIDGEGGKQTLLGSVPGVSPPVRAACWGSRSPRRSRRTGGCTPT